jgi:hypothetical protein
VTKRKPTNPLPIAQQARALAATYPASMKGHLQVIDEIARELDIPPSTVRRALSRKSIAEASGRKPNAKCPTCGQRIPNKQVTP